MEKFVNRKYFIFLSLSTCRHNKWKKFIFHDFLFHFANKRSTHSFSEKVSHVSEKNGMNRNTCRYDGAARERRRECFIVCLSFPTAKYIISFHENKLEIKTFTYRLERTQS